MELTKKMIKMLNAQYNLEVESAQIYLQMSSFCSANYLPGAASWFMNQYREEIIHANKFYDYILERGEMVIVDGFKSPKHDYENLMDMLETSLGHEKIVTASIHELMMQARKDNDFGSEIFLNWFISEQIEEENSFTDLIGRLKLFPNDQILMFDDELALRTPPVAEPAE